MFFPEGNMLQFECTAQLSISTLITQNKLSLNYLWLCQFCLRPNEAFFSSFSLSLCLNMADDSLSAEQSQSN